MTQWMPLAAPTSLSAIDHAATFCLRMAGDAIAVAAVVTQQSQQGFQTLLELPGRSGLEAVGVQVLRGRGGGDALGQLSEADRGRSDPIPEAEPVS